MAQDGNASDRGRAVIIGGGVIGTACAHFLMQRGWQVTIVEQGEFASGASHANCGYLSPSHILPLAMPGAVRNALKMMWSKNSPIYVKPRLDFRLLGWLWNFSRRCNEKDMLTAGAARHALLQSSRTLYDELIREERLDCEYETRGLLFTYQDPGKFEHFAAEEALIREHFGVAARRLYGGELVELEPALKPGLAGAWLYEIDAHLRPDRLMSSWRAVLEKRGVMIRERTPARGFTHEGGRATALLTDGEQVPGDVFIVATGALTPLLEKHLGCRVPIQPGKGYSITMPRPARCPVYPTIFPEVKVAVTPFRSGYRLGSTMEFSGYDETLNPKRLNALKEGAAKFLHEPYCEPVEEQWYGWRPMTYDGVPMISRAPVAENLFLAAGHNMLGLSMAPATGKLIAELVTGESPHIDPTPYDVRRFA